ncbi:MAG TPA: polysaccharide deacetylase family protein [Pirellulales bacterium]|nr:polysaccharide deacetylase family protein [Pirellulales bacterium]
MRLSFSSRCLLSAYYHGTYPYRLRRNRRAAAAGRAPVIVLFYHRVADEKPNDWTCSHAMFARQMRWLKRRCDMVSLAEAQRRIRRGNHRTAVSVTFDDGYAENCDRAIPLLLAERIPCTYFVAVGNVFEGLPFAHDVARGEPRPPNTLDQLRAMAAAGIEIGAHTRSHADLGAISHVEHLRDEVVAAGEELQTAIGHPVRYFAFPFGLRANLNPLAFQAAYEAGYDGVCSAYGGYNFPGDDDFHLQRIHADDDLLRLANWVTVDPRKLRAPRYDGYRLSHLPEPAGAPQA